MSFDWIVLLPPLIVLISAAVSRHVIASLCAGIISASLIYTKCAPIQTITHIGQSLFHTVTEPSKVELFAFLAILGAIIELMTQSGGVAAYTKFMQRFVKSKRGGEGASLILSSIFFLDDYLNSLTTGSIMRPLTDALRIPRVKLAFLLNAMSSPLCPLIPVTTWAAMIITQLQDAGISDKAGSSMLINADPLFTYVTTIPFIFYAFFIILTAVLVVTLRLSFGTIHKQELCAEQTGNLFGGKEPFNTPREASTSGSLADFFVPILTFVAGTIFFLFYSGNSILLGGSHSLVETLRNADTMVSLLRASILTLLVIALTDVLKYKFSILKMLKKVNVAVIQGIKLMKNSLTVLLLAFTFGHIINNDLQSGAYLANIISASLPLAILPLIIFILATITTASTGSSWGTIAILMHLTVTTLASLASTAATLPLAISSVPLLFPSIGALIAGSVAGAHFSPITDATVVSAMSAGAYHLDHVKTMISYALPALIGTGISFLIMGFTASWNLWTSYFIALAAGIFVTVTLLLVRHLFAKKNNSAPCK